MRAVSKHADNLVQLDNGKKIPPKGWKCEKCDMTENLWLNLTDGSILCGRKFFDGTGGNNHAVEHYDQTRYPLAVKLGTITPDTADVYSYDEDDMVEDPKLQQHLAHFGINIMNMEKTEKTMLELELDLNSRPWESSAIQESDVKLEPAYGPGCTGMYNLGNSCYLNSVMQVLFSVDDFSNSYHGQANDLFDSCTTDPALDFNVQMAKLGNGLLSGDYSKADAESYHRRNGVRPNMFRALIGKGHREFSTKRMQDAHEFLLHLLYTVQKNSVHAAANAADAFKFKVEDRVECTGSGKVKYLYHDEYTLAVPVPLEAATNKEEVAAYEQKKADLEAQGQRSNQLEVVRPRIPFNACIEALKSPYIVEDFYSSALKKTSVAKKSMRLATFPDYLFVHMQKFTVGADWVERKLDVSMDMPDIIDLAELRGRGKQPGEEELPDDAPKPAEPAVQLDEAVIAQLVDMGFPLEGCKKAVYHTKNTGAEAAMNWIMEHMSDPDFSEPLQLPGSSTQSAATAAAPSDDAIAMIESMGFTRQQAIKALQATDNNLERAADWIFSHADELNSDPSTAAQPVREDQPKDGSEKYRLVAFISHIGTSSKVGHYVCHILKEGRWVIYNDEKVAFSQHPPKDMAYLYLYQRIAHV